MRKGFLVLLCKCWVEFAWRFDDLIANGEVEIVAVRMMAKVRVYRMINDLSARVVPVLVIQQ